MEFRTILKAERADFEITHAHALLCIGSCFAENIGQRLHSMKFNAMRNPRGIVYNPISIARQLAALSNPALEDWTGIFQHQNLWQHYEWHSSFAHSEKEIALATMQQQQADAAQFLKICDYLIVTLGTANVFEHHEYGLVANCHKVAANQFQKRRLSVSEIVQTLGQTMKQLCADYPNLRIITSVSPVRHLRDGIIENQRSKATLSLALADICAQLDRVTYFPAYELLMDDLRDYRFYESDMMHPTQQAVDYIWEYFCTTYFNNTTLTHCEAIEGIHRAVAHRPFHSDSAQYQTFIQKTILKISSLEILGMDFKNERTVLAHYL